LGGVVIIWLTGLPGSGKTTIANSLAAEMGFIVLDGDIVRRGLCTDLGYSEKDRKENIRRAGELCKLLSEQGFDVVTAFISPYEIDRQFVKGLVPIVEVYLDCPLSECERRDPKGMYKKARAGEITGFTGIDAPYEAPANPDVIVNTKELTVSQCVQMILDTVYL
jgi:adenylylsulfate kinase